MRGKHTQSATTRRAISERDQQIESYQHAIKRLTAENKSLKERLQSQEKEHSQDVRRLKAERDEGLSPMVTVLQRENKDCRERAERAEREAKKAHNQSSILTRRVIDHFKAVHHLPGTQALEEMIRLLHPGDFDQSVVLSMSIPENAVPRGDAEAAVRIARARGERQ